MFRTKRDHGLDVFDFPRFTYLDWLNGVQNNPPSESIMVKPRCVGSCCHDAANSLNQSWKRERDSQTRAQTNCAWVTNI